MQYKPVTIQEQILVLAESVRINTQSIRSLSHELIHTGKRITQQEEQLNELGELVFGETQEIEPCNECE